MTRSISDANVNGGAMKVWAVVAPILVSILLGLLLNTVSGLGKRVDELERESKVQALWRGEISATTAVNGQKVDQALRDMATTNQILSDIRVDLARRPAR